MKKLGAALFCLLFALPFGLGGAIGIHAMWQHLAAWAETRSWEPTMAEVLDTQLERSGRKNDVFRVTASYRYTVERKTYASTRVGLDESQDNIGGWHEERHHELKEAMRTGQPVLAWYNPAHPEQAVVDRELRVGMVMFLIPFAVLFPLISLSAFWVLFHTLLASAGVVTPAGQPSENLTAIRAEGRGSLFPAWFFATFWCLLSFPLSFLMFPRAIDQPWLLVMSILFPLVGVGLLWRAIKLSAAYARQGEMWLTLQPQQPVLGSAFAARFRFARKPSADDFVVTLICEQVTGRGRSTTKWRQEYIAHPAGGELAVTLAPPASQCPSEDESEAYHRWRILLRFPGSDVERAFDIFVNRSRGAFPETVSSFLAKSTVGIIGHEVSARSIPSSIARVQEGPAGIRVDFNPANRRESAWMLLGGSGLALAIGLALVAVGKRGSEVMPTVLGPVFLIGSAALMLWAIRCFTHRLSVGIAHGRATVWDHWLLHRSNSNFTADDVRDIRSRVTASSTTMGKQEDHRQILAVLKNGRKVSMGIGIRDEYAAQVLMHLYRRHL